MAAASFEAECDMDTITNSFFICFFFTSFFLHIILYNMQYYITGKEQHSPGCKVTKKWKCFDCGWNLIYSFQNGTQGYLRKRIDQHHLSTRVKCASICLFPGSPAVGGSILRHWVFSTSAPSPLWNCDGGGERPRSVFEERTCCVFTCHNGTSMIPCC